MTEQPQPQPRRYTFDQHGRVMPPGPRRRPNPRKYLTVLAERIIKTCYPGEIQAVVIERALKRMAKADGLLTPKTGQPRRRT